MRFCMLAMACFVLHVAAAQKFVGVSQPADYVGLPTDTLTLLSWNVEHFVDAYDNPYIRNNQEDKPDTSRLRRRVEQLAEVVRLSGADVVILQEFESRAFAMQIVRQQLSAAGFRFFAANESPDWYMNVVIMSKVPIGMVYGYGAIHSPIEGYRDSLGRAETQNNINTRICSAEIRVSDAFSFILTGVHLKAGNQARDAATRLGQINLLLGQQRRWLREDPRVRLIVAGDFNALPDSTEFVRLLAGKPQQKLIDPLANTAVYSHPADKPSRRIDHILCNAAMQKSLVAGSVKPFVPFAPEVMRQMSDHLPMIAKFRVKG